LPVLTLSLNAGNDPVKRHAGIVLRDAIGTAVRLLAPRRVRCIRCRLAPPAGSLMKSNFATIPHLCLFFMQFPLIIC